MEYISLISGLILGLSIIPFWKLSGIITNKIFERLNKRGKRKNV